MNLKEKLLELQNSYKGLLQSRTAMLDVEGYDEAAYKALEEKCEKVKADIARVKGLIEETEIASAPEQPIAQPMKSGAAQPSSESTKAFAKAFRAGFKSMNEGTGADGGYTVPEDIVTKVEKLVEASDSLKNEIRIESVKTDSGRRTYKTRQQAAGFSKVGEGQAIGTVGGPKFSILSYNVDKYSGVLPVTNELREDSDEQILDVCLDWAAAESNAGWNKEILGVIQSQTEVNLGGLDGIRKALFVTLGAAFRKTAKVYTNDDGMFYLSQLKDEQGRYLVQPSATEPGASRLAVGAATYPIVVLSNDTMPTVDCKIPFILGDLHEGVVGFDRKQLTFRTTEDGAVAGFNAFEQDMTLIRAIERYQVKLRDAKAVVNGFVDGSAVVDDPHLKSLKIGSLTLSPAFNKDKTAYTAATTNASDKVTAQAFDQDASITILNGETAVENGANATWSAGENVLTVTVVAGGATKTYTVTVTKS